MPVTRDWQRELNQKYVDNFEKAALDNTKRGHNSYARELRDAGRIVRHLVKSGLKRNWLVSVFDGEEWTLQKSDDFYKIMDALFTTDMDTIRFSTPSGTRVGNFYLVYGNAGYEVISDYSDNVSIERFMKSEIEPYVTAIETGAYDRS